MAQRWGDARALPLGRVASPFSMSTVRAIVLRRRDSGESDRRLTLLTLEEGRIEVIAKGARKGGSRLAGSSEPLTMGEMELAIGRHQRFLTQVQPITSFPGLRADYDRLQYALCLAELYASVSTHGHPSEAAFHLLEKSLAALETHETPQVAMIWALLKLLQEEGVLPSWTLCSSSGKPLVETPAWVSPHAGGYVDSDTAPNFNDRFAVDARVLLGLEKVSELEEPPRHLKFSAESLSTLMPFLEEASHAPLPGCRALAESPLVL